jgi:hypothetical protein
VLDAFNLFLQFGDGNVLLDEGRLKDLHLDFLQLNVIVLIGDTVLKEGNLLVLVQEFVSETTDLSYSVIGI